MEINLFPDQEEVLAGLRASLARNKATLLQAATGSGKTVIGSKMVKGVFERKRRCIFDVPRRDLLKQTSETFTQYGIPHSFISAGKPFDPFAYIYIGTADTMANRLDKLPKDIDLLISDEIHFGAENRGKVIDFYAERGALRVGLSATPCDMNGSGKLRRWYRDMVQGKSVKWLIDNGRLARYDYYEGRTQEDFHALQKKSEKEISSFMESKRVIVGDCVSDYKKRCIGKRHIVRCTSIAHSQITAETFRENGVIARHVDGTTLDDEKLRVFIAFAKGEIAVITFADLLSFGWDLSSYTGLNVNVESGSDLRPCKSLPAQLQYWGRVLRYKPYPAIFNDHVNNWKEHGLPCFDREWSLDSFAKKTGAGTIPVKNCPSCYYTHYPAPSCPNCGHVYETEVREISQVDGELVKVDIEAMRGTLQPRYSDGFADILPPHPKQTEETLNFLVQYAINNKVKNPYAWATNELAKRTSQ